MGNSDSKPQLPQQQEQETQQLPQNGWDLEENTMEESCWIPQNSSNYELFKPPTTPPISNNSQTPPTQLSASNQKVSVNSKSSNQKPPFPSSGKPPKVPAPVSPPTNKALVQSPRVKRMRLSNSATFKTSFSSFSSNSDDVNFMQQKVCHPRVASPSTGVCNEDSNCDSLFTTGNKPERLCVSLLGKLPVEEAPKGSIGARLKFMSAWFLSYQRKSRSKRKDPQQLINSLSFPSALNNNKNEAASGWNWKWIHSSVGSSKNSSKCSSNSCYSTPQKQAAVSSTLQSSTISPSPNSSRRRDALNHSQASLNSLLNGRTPWPMPWMDAIYLPDFPTRSPIKEDDFEIVGMIAKASFGNVYRVASKAEPDQLFAMKVQRKSDVLTRDAVHQIKDEVSIHLSGGPFIAQLHFAWQNRVNLYMVSQFVNGYGDLYQLWRDKGPFPESFVRICAAEIAVALEFIHSSDVIYRDLKMENILVDENGHIQITDFGLAKRLSSDERTNTICGTLQYMAPEILHMEEYGHKADWWSLGALLHTLVKGEYPFGTAEDYMSMRIDNYMPPPEFSIELQTLLEEKLLCKSPYSRLGCLDELSLQPFFRTVSLDFDDLNKLKPFNLIPSMKRCPSCNDLNTDFEEFDGDFSSVEGDDSNCFFQESYKEHASLLSEDDL